MEQHPCKVPRDAFSTFCHHQDTLPVLHLIQTVNILITRHVVHWDCEFFIPNYLTFENMSYPAQVRFSCLGNMQRKCRMVAEFAAFKWGLWITQIKCDGTTSLQSPKGCFQYFLPSSGYLTSFAFDSNGQYLNNQACSTLRLWIFYT